MIRKCQNYHLDLHHEVIWLGIQTICSTRKLLTWIQFSHKITDVIISMFSSVPEVLIDFGLSLCFHSAIFRSRSHSSELAIPNLERFYLNKAVIVIVAEVVLLNFCLLVWTIDCVAVIAVENTICVCTLQRNLTLLALLLHYQEIN